MALVVVLILLGIATTIIGLLPYLCRDWRVGANRASALSFCSRPCYRWPLGCSRVVAYGERSAGKTRLLYVCSAGAAYWVDHC